MVQVQRLTAETLLSAPRRSPAVPSPDGRLALYTVSTHGFGKRTLHEIKVMNIESHKSFLITADEGAHDAVWVPGTSDVLFFKQLLDGRTQVVYASGEANSYNERETKEQYVVAEIEAPIANLKLKALDDGSVIFAVTGLVGNDGKLHNDTTTEISTARIFDGARIRTGCSLYKTQPYSIWYSRLEICETGRWCLAGPLLNVVNESRLDAPTGILEGEDVCTNFDISHRGVVFVARDRRVRSPTHRMVCSAWFIRLDSFSLPPTSPPQPISLPPNLKKGMTTNIRFSPEAFSIGMLHSQLADIYDNRLLIASTGSLNAFDVFSLVTGPLNSISRANGHTSGDEHDPPSGFEFAGSGDHVILRTNRCGRQILSSLKLHDGATPTIFFSEGTVSAFYPLGDNNWDALLVSSSSFVDSSLWQIAHIPSAAVVTTVSSATRNGGKFGLSLDMVSEFWYEGADSTCVHAFMMRPSGFDETKKYPWVVMLHGGPVSSYRDEWSTRWNMAAWAQQGYIVVCPNLTGSLGYGREFANRIRNQFGGRPFQDVLNLTAYLDDLPYLDREKGVLVGSSFGAYMISWIMGHEIINKFCCSIWHAGVFSLPPISWHSDLYEYGNSESLYPWMDPDQSARYNPARPELLRNWSKAPPTLITHGEKDYLYPIVEGIGVYNTLKAQGVPCRLLTFPDEGHFITGSENLLVWYETVWDWVGRCVSGKIQRGQAAP